MIDLRSDTVTKPTPAMRRAMAEAEVGDDVYGEDPTVNRLQELAAEIFQKEAALYVPTGSMGNQIAVKLHTRPGNEVVIEERGHIYNFEMATMAAFSGCVARPVHSKDGSGILTWDEIAGCASRQRGLLRCADRTDRDREFAQPRRRIRDAPRARGRHLRTRACDEVTGPPGWRAHL